MSWSAWDSPQPPVTLPAATSPIVEELWVNQFTLWSKPFQSFLSGYLLLICIAFFLMQSFVHYSLFTAATICAGRLPFVPHVPSPLCSLPCRPTWWTLSRVPLHVLLAPAEDRRVRGELVLGTCSPGLLPAGAQQLVSVSPCEAGRLAALSVFPGSANCSLPAASYCQGLHYRLWFSCTLAF